jgi:hypothetical protein
LCEDAARGEQRIAGRQDDGVTPGLDPRIGLTEPDICRTPSLRGVMPEVKINDPWRLART